MFGAKCVIIFVGFTSPFSLPRSFLRSCSHQSFTTWFKLHADILYFGFVVSRNRGGGIPVFSYPSFHAESRSLRSRCFDNTFAWCLVGTMGKFGAFTINVDNNARRVHDVGTSYFAPVLLSSYSVSLRQALRLSSCDVRNPLY